MFNKIYKSVIMCFLQNSLTSHMDPYSTTNVKSLQLGAHCSTWGPFTYIQDHLNQNSTTWAHCSSCGPFTYIQDQMR